MKQNKVEIITKIVNWFLIVSPMECNGGKSIFKKQYQNNWIKKWKKSASNFVSHHAQKLILDYSPNFRAKSIKVSRRKYKRISSRSWDKKGTS